MKYVTMGKTGLKVSRYGLGCMRLPMLEEGVRDPEIAIPIIRKSIEAGVNYIDTAYVYPGSEAVVGKALEGGYREKIYLATKSPVWLVQKYEDFFEKLDEELQRLKTDYVDFYLLHNLNRKNWQHAKSLGGLEFLQEAKAKGKIRFGAFSFHDEYEVFEEVMRAAEWDMCQIQYNFMDTDRQAGIKGYELAKEMGVPVVVMEPLRGGNIIKSVTGEAKEPLTALHPERSVAEWAFKWLYNQENIAVILSGVTSMEQNDENLAIFDQAEVGSMTKEEEAAILQTKAIVRSRMKVGCTGCRYCMPCPNNVAIPQIFANYNDYYTVGDVNLTRNLYSDIAQRGQSVAECVECGICVEHCPQGIDIPEMLKEAHKTLAKA